MKIAVFTLITSLLFVAAAGAQTSDFTYQGSLNLSGSPANGGYDFEFRLFDAENGGSQIGSTASRTGVAVTNGVFNVSLSFAGAFPGTDRWMEISVRQAGSGGGYQQLLPRVKVNSSPYSIKSQSAETATTATNAQNLGGVAANQYVQTTDPRMTDARPPTAGSGSYVQNGTTVQASANFNVSGTGKVGGEFIAGTIRSQTGYYQETNFGTDLILFNPGNSTFVGSNQARTGVFSAFLGHNAGQVNTTGSFNAFLGSQAGIANTTGANNTFVGYSAGYDNTTGSHLTLLGNNAGVSVANLTYAAAVGSGSRASLSNSIFLGRPGGEDTVRIPGNLNLTGAASLNGNLVVATGGISVFNGNVVIPTLGSAGSTTLCRNASNFISTCSSSLRYKTNINPFASGLDLVRRLQPITFDWKDGGLNDLGLGAEDVAAIEPLLVTYNREGQVEGVKYDRIGVVLVNAVKEQQRQIDEQRAEIQALRAALCELKPQLSVCNSQEKK